MNSFRTVLILVAVLSLAVNVATRYCNLVSPDIPSHQISKAHSVEGKHQHLLKDALHWSKPSENFLLFEPSRLVATVWLLASPVARFHLQDCLYNRPPPQC